MGLRTMVVGGGIGGLAAAIGLRKAGCEVTVLERAPALAATGAGISLWPNALYCLDELGVGDDVAPLLCRQDSGGLRDWRGRRLTRFDGAAFERRFGKPLAAVHRATLIEALRDALPADCVRTDTSVTSVGPDGIVRGHGGVIAEADLVVGADGVASTTREDLVDAPPRPTFSGVTAFRAVISAPGDTGLGTVWGPGAEVGIVPLVGEKVYWWASLNAPQQRASGDATAFLHRRFREWPPDVRELLEHTTPQALLHHDIEVLPTRLRSYVHGRAALLGDAAHSMTPFLGQGGCQAIEDAVVLAAKIARCAGDPARIPDALRRYDEERRPRTQSLVRASDRMGRIGHRLRNPAAVTARDTLLRLVPESFTARGMSAAAGWRPPAILPR